jgi:hypothetical protein
MSELQLILSLGIGGGIAVILVVWITKGLVPALLKTFHDEMEAERAMHREVMAQIVTSMREIRDEVRLGRHHR